FKREAQEYDDEALQITSQLLCSNPDFYTLWNFRKEIILHLSKEKVGDDLQQLLENELLLVEECLRKNPKSYGAWHHRRWSLLLMPKPNWNKEIYLCNKFLEMDERNFHGWDFRRFVCNKAEVKPSDELNFTLKKIEANFSNYSAWHYRSSLLPVIYKGKIKGTVKEEKLLEEYELVQNAAFTDPSDQSVWFYHRWLLGRKQKPLQINSVYIKKSLQKVIIQLSQPVLAEEIEEFIKIYANDVILNVKWNKPTPSTFASSVWICLLPTENNVGDQNTEIDISLTVNDYSDKIKCLLNAEEEEKHIYNEINKSNIFRDEMSASTTSVLEQELESCKQLQDLEPNNKWILFTIVLLMRALKNEQYNKLILECLDQLTEVDPKRKNYFYDLKSRFIIQNAIEEAEGNNEINLSRKQLTSLHHVDFFATAKAVDLSYNLLKSVQPLCYLVCVRNLILDNNSISSCFGLGNLKQLENLSIKNNNLMNIPDIADLVTCPLKTLNLEGNLITKMENFEYVIISMFVHLKVLDGKGL
ncbi:geranylgeranyl transferase type-2 subunit alpha-like, partial [Centruroides sculpturatus]|uniref:geranylgeranyl transferase type-2 subunit alpha-like n=1 Tax=Centruroides sculpturatus TaxID=218467 RepID=UPI000C6DF4D2